MLIRASQVQDSYDDVHLVNRSERSLLIRNFILHKLRQRGERFLPPQVARNTPSALLLGGKHRLHALLYLYR